MHYCTLCGTYHNNPKQVRAHLNSSCHERAIIQRARDRERARRCDLIWSTCARMRKLDQWHVAWEHHYRVIHDELQSCWPILERIEKRFKLARRMHANHMRSWWMLVCMRLPIHCVSFEVTKWLAPFAPPAAINWNKPPTRYSQNGNLNLRNLIYRRGHRRHRDHSSYPVITYQNMTQTCPRSLTRCASPMDLD